ncbi:hypothetical protein B0H66DRAFT_141007 [Apodospora peruviana]|uniref:Telomeric single stranded DNA binding POT1/Cdc13 domain-containing protein n=1 Tax=Apodospora peruviana TaxID=516989 RepID=A0AAE0MAZ2_9PEZI|nr:hypothetical protein B0H66DRAFT_141007 [Apodospora peruviana]
MASLLASRDATPIAQLNPDLPNQAERVVCGEVTITWPYNSVAKTSAFLIAEPDIRLRRAKGQVRIELHGASAKTIAECGLGAGDEVLFSLDGVEWAKDSSPGRVPGARLEWQLKFDKKLSLQVKLSDSSEPKHIDIDHPTTATEPVVELAPPRQSSPVEEEKPASAETPVVRKVADFAVNEYPSPAFIKRARISYGSLFEGGMDIFEDDGGVPGKGRKRTRFGRDSSAWRYSSQSPSPEPTTPVQNSMDQDVVMETQHERSPRPSAKPSPRPQMTDEGCQTVEFDTTPGSSAPMEEIAGTGPLEKPESPQMQPEQQTLPQSNDTATVEAPRSSPEPPGAVEAAASSLFAISNPIGSGFSMFGTTSTVPVDSGSNIADQVRFGFSHIPQTALPSAAHDSLATSESEAYPASYLDPPAPAKFADMETYVDVAEEEMEIAQGHGASPHPPTVESFDRGRWEMQTQSPHYNNIEGGHFGTDALLEGTPVGAEEPFSHSDGMPVEMLPKGFGSYGVHEEEANTADDADIVSWDSAQDGDHHAVVELVQNAETYNAADNELGVEDEEDAEYDEYGDEIEEGDYDQRNYSVPADDEEGLSEEDEEIEQETAERYGEGDVYSEEEEDGYGEAWEGEEDYDESEGSYESGDEPEPQSFRTPAAATASSEPVVIDLISDSEDEDDPPALPSKPAAKIAVAQQGFQPREPLEGKAKGHTVGHMQGVAQPAAEIAPQEEEGSRIANGDALNDGDEGQSDRDEDRREHSFATD